MEASPTATEASPKRRKKEAEEAGRNETVAAIWFQVLDVGAVQGIGWAAAAAGSGVIAYFPLRRYKARNGRDVTYTIEMIERGEFVKETAE